MKSRKNIMLFVGLLAIFVLSACGSQTVATTEVPVEIAPTENVQTEIEPTEDLATEIAPVEETQATDLSNLTDAEMEALISEKAAGHHTLEFILSHNFTAEEWSTTLDRMIGHGAKISAEEKAAIIEWLVNR